MIETLFSLFPYFGALLFVLFLIFAFRSQPSRKRRRRVWDNDSHLNSSILSTPLMNQSEEPLSISGASDCNTGFDNSNGFDSNGFGGGGDFGGGGAGGDWGSSGSDGSS